MTKYDFLQAGYVFVMICAGASAILSIVALFMPAPKPQGDAHGEGEKK